MFLNLILEINKRLLVLKIFYLNFKQIKQINLNTVYNSESIKLNQTKSSKVLSFK